MFKEDTVKEEKLDRLQWKVKSEGQRVIEPYLLW